MTLFERVKSLAKKRNKNLKEVALELGLSENAFYSWKKSAPSSDNLQKVADYFNVSTDYLLGREEKELTEDDLSVLFRLNTDGLSDEKKEKVKEEMTRFMKFVIEDLKDDD
ncbi:helix-turn-helix transcriptional regulator [Carnobacterium maltaromaticum]|uniref:helix-turn-helix domain-containing protein n=1 Tax=Carnobacterium maltaromaticum TaxID=2751 RepID=UPI00295F4C48|nr:helix-turn-helix transcriptional regulator [Carnobacterium maltaromaticum]